MKRCTQCEFIYEDDQSVCDMDGQSLTSDYAFPVASTSEKSASPLKPSSLRGIALPAGAGLLMALLFSVGFYASADTVQPGSEATIPQVSNALQAETVFQAGAPFSLAQASVSAPSTEPQLKVSEPEEGTAIQAGDPSTDAAKRAHGDRDKLAISRSLPPLPRVRPLPRLPAAKPVDREASNITVVRSSVPSSSRKLINEKAHSPKSESKVGGFLKKTGRFLSKPFKR